MTVVGKLRAWRHAGAIAERAHELDAVTASSDRRAIQLELLNQEWSRVVRDVPHYAGLHAKGLPDAFSSLEEFARLVPATRREDVQTQLRAMSSGSRRAQWFRITGGSTAAPVQLPAWKSENDGTRLDLWAARGWYGIHPDSRLFLLWGHSHLLGSGWRGWLKASRVALFDRLLGYYRFSAYDLRPEAMDRAGATLLRFRPDYLLGYSTALDLFARANQHRRDALRRGGVRLVIATAESFPSLDSEERLRDLFACPVAMEYGAVETGLIAHSHPAGGFRVLWRSHLVEGVGEGARQRIRITSLYPRAFPLVRYEIGDEIDLAEGVVRGGSLFAFRAVAGRCNDYVELADGTIVHSEAFSHAVRPCAALRGYQIVQSGSELRLRFTAERPLEQDEISGIRDRLQRIHPGLEEITFERVGALDQTVAGKTRMVVRAP